MALDLDLLETRVGRAYEKGRLWHAVSVSAPILLLASLVWVAGAGRGVVLTLVGLLFGLEALLVWRGQQLGRGALGGLAGGLIPLVFGLCMQTYMHVCGGMLGGPICTAVCTTGGLLAGLVIATIARRQPSSSLAFAGAAAATATLLGAIGCVCAGLAGVAGLLVGVAVPVAVERAQAAAALP